MQGVPLGVPQTPQRVPRADPTQPCGVPPGVAHARGYPPRTLPCVVPYPAGYPFWGYPRGYPQKGPLGHRVDLFFFFFCKINETTLRVCRFSPCRPFFLSSPSSSLRYTNGKFRFWVGHKITEHFNYYFCLSFVGVRPASFHTRAATSRGEMCCLSMTSRGGLCTSRLAPREDTLLQKPGRECFPFFSKFFPGITYDTDFHGYT